MFPATTIVAGIEELSPTLKSAEFTTSSSHYSRPVASFDPGGGVSSFSTDNCEYHAGRYACDVVDTCLE